MAALKISDDKSLLNLNQIHHFLSSESSWARGISLEIVARSIRNSVCIGAYSDNEQVGFCRIITDHATFANLVDVIVWPEYRGKGISLKLLDAVMVHPSVKGVRRFTLATSNAHGLYQKYGFKMLQKPDSFMEIYLPDIYVKV